MKHLGLALVVMASALIGCNKMGSRNVELKTDVQKSSYAIGQQIGREIKGQGLDVDVDAIAASIQDAIAGKESRITMAEMQQVMQRMNEKMMSKQAEAGKANKEKGEKFLAENKGKKGVETTTSGLQYEVVKTGDGPKPKETDEVKVDYKGTLLDGTEFDSSYKRGESAVFPVTGVIKGWTEALKMMPVGSKWKIYVPSELAYGERGRPGIPPASVLTFEVDLKEIVKRDAPKPLPMGKKGK